MSTTLDADDVRVAAVVLAAGLGVRYGGDKLSATLGSKPVWRWSYDALAQHPRVAEVVLVGSDSLAGLNGVVPVPGGASRQASAAAGVAAVGEADIILLHDAARPFLSAALVDAVIDACRLYEAAAPAIPVSDTLRSRSNAEVVDRDGLMAMQTPQGGRTDLVRRALAQATAEFTDDVALLASFGATWKPVAGEVANFKITMPEDLERARRQLRHEVRNGLGYDVHAFSGDPARPLWLGGVKFDGAPGLDGHSDADALIHAVVDALLGAAALGDIGTHFPPGDSQWKDEPSATFLCHASRLLKDRGWQIGHIDATVIAERPKIMPRASEIRSTIAGAAGIATDQVSVKATTNEGLGAIGRGEGIAAFATVTLERWL